MNECERAKVEVRTHCKVESVVRDERDDGEGFTIETNQGTFHAASLVVATGGLSIPKIGATDFGYRVAKQFGVRVTQLRPALVPLRWKPSESTDEETFRELSGVSFNSNVVCNRAQFEENILVTHRGLSGPAILQISSYWRERDAITVDLVPHVSIEIIVEMLQSRAHENTELATVLGQFLPTRFARAWCNIFARSQPLNRFAAKELIAVAEKLKSWCIAPHGTEGYAKAEVTLGGVNTDELSSKTLEAKRVAGLYFIGEVVDVTGWLGGYNFQWAWASGYAAGQCA
ncbi:MAG: hypothetical protein NVSMB56_20200 [Pyrinomonadaceae bacterium]